MTSPLTRAHVSGQPKHRSKPVLDVQERMLVIADCLRKTKRACQKKDMHMECIFLETILEILPEIEQAILVKGYESGHEIGYQQGKTDSLMELLRTESLYG